MLIHSVAREIRVEDLLNTRSSSGILTSTTCINTICLSFYTYSSQNCTTRCSHLPDRKKLTPIQVPFGSFGSEPFFAKWPTPSHHGKPSGGNGLCVCSCLFSLLTQLHSKIMSSSLMTSWCTIEVLGNL